MKFEHFKMVDQDLNVYRLEISRGELAQAHLDRFDRILIRDIEDDPEATIADKLLGLEMLTRRIQQAYEKASIS